MQQLAIGMAKKAANAVEGADCDYSIVSLLWLQYHQYECIQYNNDSEFMGLLVFFL